MKISLLFQNNNMGKIRIIQISKMQFYFLIIFSGLYMSPKSDAQSYIGLIGGITEAKLFDFTNNEEYNAKYHLRNGASFSSFYEMKMDSVTNLRIELQYKFQNADMEIKNHLSHASSSYKNLDFSFHQANLNLVFTFQLLEKHFLKIDFLIGPTVSYTINTKSEGKGWDIVYETQTDTSGNPIQILTAHTWEKNESKSKDISLFNFGFDCGFDFMIPINDKIDFISQNKYNVSLTHLFTLDHLKYTSLFTGYLNIGLRYKFKKKV